MGVSEFLVLVSPGRGGDIWNGDQTPPGQSRDRCSSLASFQLLFTAILIYLFILCLLVLPGLILDQPVLEECHNKGFAEWLSVRNSECGNVLGALGPPICLFEVLEKGLLSSWLNIRKPSITPCLFLEFSCESSLCEDKQFHVLIIPHFMGLFCVLIFRRAAVKLEVFHLSGKNHTPYLWGGETWGAVEINYFRRATIKDE